MNGGIDQAHLPDLQLLRAQFSLQSLPSLHNLPSSLSFLICKPFRPNLVFCLAVASAATQSNSGKLTQPYPHSAGSQSGCASRISCPVSHKPIKSPHHLTPASFLAVSMADLAPHGKPTKGKADDTTGPSGDQNNNEIQGKLSIGQILEEQKAGRFDLKRDFGKIKNPSEFYRLLREYEAMNDNHKPCTDFPTDSKILMQWVLKTVKAICNKDRATDATNKKIASARQDEEDPDGRDRPGDEADGNNESIARSENRPSSAVTHLNRLKAAEVELGGWKVVVSFRHREHSVHLAKESLN